MLSEVTCHLWLTPLTGKALCFPCLPLLAPGLGAHVRWELGRAPYPELEGGHEESGAALLDPDHFPLDS